MCNNWKICQPQMLHPWAPVPLISFYHTFFGTTTSIIIKVAIWLAFHTSVYLYFLKQTIEHCMLFGAMYIAFTIFQKGNVILSLKLIKTFCLKLLFMSNWDHLQCLLSQIAIRDGRKIWKFFQLAFQLVFNLAVLYEWTNMTCFFGNLKSTWIIDPNQELACLCSYFLYHDFMISH